MKRLLFSATFLSVFITAVFFILIVLTKAEHGAVFLFHSYQPVGDYGGDVYMYDVDHHSQVQITLSGGWFSDKDAVISPDYQFIAASQSSGTLAIFGLARAGWSRHTHSELDDQLLLGMVPLFWNNGVTYWGKAAWSPKSQDGVMHLAFSTNEARDIDFHEWRYNNIWIADVPQRRWQLSDVMLPQQGGFFPPLGIAIRDTRHRMTNTNANDDDMSWSPDGSQIAFTSDRGGSLDIYLLDTDGIDKNVRRITRSVSVESSPSWSPDGKWLVFASKQDNNSQLYIVSANGGESRQLTSDLFENIRPSWSPDGQYIVYLSSDLITLIRPDGSNMQRLFAGSNPTWIP